MDRRPCDLSRASAHPPAAATEGRYLPFPAPVSSPKLPGGIELRKVLMSGHGWSQWALIVVALQKRWSRCKDAEEGREKLVDRAEEWGFNVAMDPWYWIWSDHPGWSRPGLCHCASPAREGEKIAAIRSPSAGGITDDVSLENVRLLATSRARETLESWRLNQGSSLWTERKGQIQQQ